MLKKVLFAVLALSLFSTGVLAGAVVKQYKTPRGNIAIVETTDVHKGRVGLKVNGEEIRQQTWYADSVTYVPLRAVAEALGAEVKYNAETMSADITMAKSNANEKVVFVDSERATYQGKNYKIVYPKNLTQDLEKTKKYMDEAIQIAKKIYDPQLEEGNFESILNDKKLQINVDLITISRNIGVRDGFNLVTTDRGVSISEIELFAPTISIGSCCTNENSDFTESHFRNHVIHEVLHAFQIYVEQFKWHSPGWYPNEHHDWAKEGIIEYYSRKQTGLLKPLKESAKTTYHTYEFTSDSFTSSNTYIFGTLFFDFLSQNYGEDKINKFLHSSQPTAAKAFKEVYGMDLGQAGSKFTQWLQK